MSILENWPYILLGMAAAFGILLLGPLFFGRIFMPRLTLKAFTRWGKFLASWLDKITPGPGPEAHGQGRKPLLQEGLRRHGPMRTGHFSSPFACGPRIARPRWDKKLGLLCDGSCEGCKVGRVRNQALELGYGHVFVVPSSRLMKTHGPFALLGIHAAKNQGNQAKGDVWRGVRLAPAQQDHDPLQGGQLRPGPPAKTCAPCCRGFFWTE